MSKKKCSGCGLEKALEEFHRRARSKDGRQSICKSCNVSKVQEWQKNNPEQYKATCTARDRNEHKLLERRAKRYGLSVRELQAMIDACNGQCPICQREPVQWLVVDHCHNSLRVRGVICERCNQGLGLFEDNIEWMQKAIRYLQAHEN